MCKSKIHSATVTEANLQYRGSITLDEILMEAADLLPYEKVQILNLNNGSRVETYVIAGKRESGRVCLNGAAARWGQAGDKILVVSYAMIEEAQARKHQAKVVFVNEQNKVEKIQSGLLV